MSKAENKAPVGAASVAPSTSKDSVADSSQATNKNRSAISRSEKSLTALTTKFMTLLQESPNGILDLRSVRLSILLMNYIFLKIFIFLSLLIAYHRDKNVAYMILQMFLKALV